MAQKNPKIDEPLITKEVYCSLKIHFDTFAANA